MKADRRFLTRFYRICLYIFPKNYVRDYGEELQAVFHSALDDAVQTGRLETPRLIVREFASLPKAALLEHLRERRRWQMIGRNGTFLDFAPGTRRELWAALAPFLFFGALPTLLSFLRIFAFVPLWVDITFTVVFWICALGLLAIGFAKRFPRWFMPYIGVPLPFFSIILFSSLMEKWQGAWWSKLNWFMSEFLQQGLLWMGQFLLIILLLAATRLFANSRPFHQRLLNDWTLLAFIVYGTVPLGLVITLSDYKNEEPFLFAALLLLAAGGWLYLRNDEPWKRFLCLHIGMTLSLLIAAVGKAVLEESSFPFTSETSWQTEFMSTMVTWLWLAIFMLIAPALNLLPKLGPPAKSIPQG